MNYIKPKFVSNYFCIYNDEQGEYCVYEKSKTIPMDVLIGITPLAHGETITEAVNNAEKEGIKHYDIQFIREVMG